VPTACASGIMPVIFSMHKNSINAMTMYFPFCSIIASLPVKWKNYFSFKNEKKKIILFYINPMPLEVNERIYQLIETLQRTQAAI
jgi:hypothetical protein